MIRIPGPRIRALHVVVLFSFAVAQPLYDLMGRHAEFLVAHGADVGDLLLIVLFLSLGLPAAIALAKWAAENLAGRLAGAIHLTTVAVLGAAVAFPVLNQTVDLPGPALASVAGLLGAGGAAAYARFRPIRAFLTVLSPVVLVFPALFLARSPLAELRAPGPVPAAADPVVESGADVVVVVLDALPLSSLMDESGRIDAARHPEFAALADRSFWFRNATTVAEETTFAVPAILTGLYPEWRLLPLAKNYPQNLFTLLAPSHDLNVVEHATKLCRKDLCDSGSAGERGARLAALGTDLAYLYVHVLLPEEWSQALPPVNSAWRDFAGRPLAAEAEGAAAPHPSRDVDSRFSKFLGQIRVGRRPALHFLHLDLPHGPYVYMPSGKNYGGSGVLRQGNRGLAGDREWASAQALQRHLLQLEYADALLGRLLRRLEQEGLYDRSLIVVTSDHGRNFRPDSPSRRIDVHNPGVADILLVPLFVKLPGQREGRVIDRNVETIDVLPTILDALGGELPERVDGHSVFDTSLPERPRKTAFAPHRDHRGRREPRRQEHVFGRSFQAQTDTVRRIYALFDFGVKRDSLFTLGAHRELLQRGVTTLSLGGPSPLVFRLDEPSLYVDVDLEASLVPAFVTGSLEGEIPGEALSLAVAVNGTIEATARSHHHTNDGARFAALVPERAFREGQNRVEVYIVTGSQPLLRPIPPAP